MLTTTIRKAAMATAALGALGLGGAAIAGAADTATSTTSTESRPPRADRPSRPDRAPLSTETAAKVKAAALEKVPGATVLRTEAGGPYATAYHAHITTSGGTRKVVLVDASFTATAVQADRGRGPGGRPGGGRGHHGPGPGPGGRGETALTGTIKEKVEAAVLAKYPGATIVRTETNADDAAPYESHVTTAGGRELEVLVSKAFAVVDAREHPARP